MVGKKTILFALINIFSYIPTLYPHQDLTTFDVQAQAWIANYIQSPDQRLLIDADDLQLIANLLYFSFLRSAITLEAQEIACKTLETAWQGWQNIARTRMNPSHKIPYTIDFTKQQILFDDFDRAQKLHRSIGSTYAQVAEAAVNQNHLSLSSKKAVNFLREESRIAILQSFLDIKNVLGELFDYAKEHVRAHHIDLEEENVRFDFLDTLSNYIPYLAMQSFIKAEKLNNQAQDQTWHIMETLNSVSKQVWHAIERTRALFYLAHFNAIIQVMRSSALPHTCYYIMFDDTGMLSNIQQTQLLPDVSNLQLNPLLY